MIIFAHTTTLRFNYIISFVGKLISDKPFEITNDIHSFRDYNGPKINYSEQRITDQEYWIQPYGLLFETGIKEQAITCFKVNDLKAFFKTNGDHPFDIFSAIFFLISRYEEYLPHEKDIYGRYSHTNSLAFKEGFLNKPLVDQWIDQLRMLLLAKFVTVKLTRPSFSFIATYDIDEAWSYKHKSEYRTAGALVKSFFKGKWSAINERKKVLSGKLQDPFDAYGWMDNLHEERNIDPRYFFLVPDKTGRYDRNILPSEAALQALISRHSEKYKIGIHPSWQSGDDTSLLSSEKQTLEMITGQPVVISRQHFIRFTLPGTFRNLVAAGIKEDYSMGYGSINGFRASTCTPYYWFDLEKEEETKLMLFPFCYMEANSFFEQKQSAAEALDEMRHYYKVVKQVNGTFISIWHNTFLGTAGMFKGWRETYEQFVQEIN